ncbi:hypothetical protein POM88_046435 [Heracleum sosnowskyi]|uniref:Uncharacterized protein n=1 Tax=Heracleum sosnowskyi TaxID=360622 RepID=A0AAD8H8U8_9APIA|nr:hypothetical protein POM88_046435 [Heracleum sosnowskyi]
MLWHAQMEQNNSVTGREAGPRGVGGIQIGGGNNNQGAAAAWGGGGPGGVAAGAGGFPSGVAARGDPSDLAAAVAAFVAGGQSGYAADGLNGVAAGADSVPSGVAAVGDPSDLAAAGADSVPSGVAAVGDPSDLAAAVAAFLAGADGKSGYAADGPNGVAASADGVPSGVVLSSDSARENKRRKQRHSQQQIDAMETYFKDDPHPDRSQRNNIAVNLGLDPTQVKHWFQNKRTQVKSHGESDENDVLRTENDMLQVQRQQLIEAMSKRLCSQCSVGNSQQITQRNNLILENSRLRNELEMLKSTIAKYRGGQNQQNLPVTYQEPQNFSVTSQNQQNHPTLHDPQNLSTISPDPQNLPIAPMQNPPILSILSHRSQNLPIISEEGNAYSDPADRSQGCASTSINRSGEGIHPINVPTSPEFRQSLIELVVSAAEELKVMSMNAETLWTPSSADGETCVLNEVEYLSTFPNIFGSPRLGYTCEASRHIAGRVLLSPTQLLNILMDANEWAFTFFDIVSKALTLDVPSEGVNYNAALRVMAAEYHLPTPLVPNRRTYFARYCTQHCEGVWAVVDVSLDQILPAPENMTCKKMPSGCLIQQLSDGTSKVTWIEHVYVDYTGVSTIYKRPLLSGMGFGAKRWVSVLERQGQRIFSANVPSNTYVFNNLPMLSPEGRTGLLMFAERMVNHFIFGITGPRTGRWTQVNGNFGDDIRLMSTRAVDEPGLLSGTLLSVTTSFALSLAPNKVFNFLRDHKHRKEWDVCAVGRTEYQPLCCISFGEEARNGVSIYKVMRRPGHIELQESWSDPVASHIVFASTEIRTLDAILGGGDPNGQPLLPFGFTILPDGPSCPIDGSSGTLLTASFQILAAAVLKKACLNIQKKALIITRVEGSSSRMHTDIYSFISIAIDSFISCIILVHLRLVLSPAPGFGFEVIFDIMLDFWFISFGVTPVFGSLSYLFIM